MNLLEKIFTAIIKLLTFSAKSQVQKIADKVIKDFRKIKIDSTSIEVFDFYEKQTLKIAWDQIVDVIYHSEVVTIKTKQNETIEIPEKSHENWYKLIQEIPYGFPNYDYSAVNSFFNKLEGCEICGLLSVDTSREPVDCLYCGNDVWQDKFKDEYSSKEEYVKECQYDEFEPIEEGDDIDISNEAQAGFATDPNWKCFITPEDYRTK